MYAGVADLYSEIGDVSLLQSLERIWDNMVESKMYVTGGTGSVSAIEGFGKKFDLKLEDSYSETCAAIANVMWNWRMFLISKNPKYADLIEKLLYNAVLVGQSLDGRKYFYSNTLLSDGEEKRDEWFKCPCCPTNFIRFIPIIGKFIYAKSKNGIFISQYIESKTEFDLENAKNLKIEQKSGFPWNGKVSLKFILNDEILFSLHLRLPLWCNDYIIKLNNELINIKPTSSGFLEIDRIWKNNDTVEIDFEMIPQLISGEQKIKDIKNKVSITYGPLIYCVEEKDNASIDFSEESLGQNCELESKFEEQLLGGVRTISGLLKSGKKFVAIPYFSWNNRGSNRMRIWLKKS